MNNGRNAAGYLVGFLLFVVLVPAVMWMVSGGPRFCVARTVAFVLLAVVGLGLSVWSIVYMRVVGKGNPMDALNHELAPRTRVLMTDGPYGICRNPMLLGIIVYYVGVAVMLGSWKAALVLMGYTFVMSIQVRFEERRLERDFGEAYAEYRSTTKRLIPFVW